jgi:nucleolar pre-ribosomal-associated protein 1
LHEKQEVVSIINRVKLLLPDTQGEHLPPRLPPYTSLLLAHALHAVFYPSTIIYPLTSCFLLQRPELDVMDVPMLYSMLYSTSDNWKKEHLWILHFLSTSISNRTDWRVFNRRHTWELLAAIFQSNSTELQIRRGIIEVEPLSPI